MRCIHKLSLNLRQTHIASHKDRTQTKDCPNTYTCRQGKRHNQWSNCVQSHPKKNQRQEFLGTNGDSKRPCKPTRGLRAQARYSDHRQIEQDFLKAPQHSLIGGSRTLISALLDEQAPLPQSWLGEPRLHDGMSDRKTHNKIAANDAIQLIPFSQNKKCCSMQPLTWIPAITRTTANKMSWRRRQSQSNWSVCFRWIWCSSKSSEIWPS